MSDSLEYDEVTAIWNGVARNDIRVHWGEDGINRLIVDYQTYEVDHMDFVRAGFFSTHHDQTDFMNLPYLRQDLVLVSGRVFTLEMGL